MKEKTDLEKCKEEARKFLKYQTDDYEGHPLFFCKYVSVRGRPVNLNEHPSTVKRKLKEKKEEVKLVLKKDIYMKSFSNIDLKFLSNNLKIVSLLVKFKCFNLLYLYCVLIQKLKKD